MLVMASVVHIFLASFICFHIPSVCLLNDFAEVYSDLWMAVYRHFAEREGRILTAAGYRLNCDTNTFLCSAARECLAEDDPFGMKYKGTMNTTMCGFTCQRWDQQYPHPHETPPHLWSEENYCRNPGDAPRPWCYTTHPYKRFQLCARLDPCGKMLFWLKSKRGDQTLFFHKNVTITLILKLTQSNTNNLPNVRLYNKSKLY